MPETIKEIPLDKLHPFPDHPFGVRDDDAIYDAGTRTGLMKALSEMRKELSADETELISLTYSTLKKLSAMTDEDYEKLEMYPDFDE